MGAFSAIAGMATMAVGTGVQMAAAKRQQEADNLARQWNATMLRQDAEFSRIKAGQARAIGDIEAAERLREAGILRGEQRAGYGASGVSVNTGSAAAIQADTMAWGAYSAAKEKYNYDLQAFDYEQQARNQDAQASMQLAGIGSSNLNYYATAIGGATNIFNTASSWKI